MASSKSGCRGKSLRQAPAAAFSTPQNGPNARVGPRTGLCLGMQLAFTPSSISLRLSPERRSKYADLVDWYREEGGTTNSQAAELAGRLNWACKALFAPSWPPS